MVGVMARRAGGVILCLPLSLGDLLNLRTFPRIVVLLWLLVVMQLGGFAHALSHLAEGTRQDEGGRVEAACLWCAAQAQLGTALPATPSSLLLLSAQPPLVEAGGAACLRFARFTAYLSQAPPGFS
jgi:hypothetical protein